MKDNLDIYYEVNGRLVQIKEIEKLNMEVFSFNEKFQHPIKAGIFFDLPHEVKMDLRKVSDKINKYFEDQIKTQQDKIKKI